MKLNRYTLLARQKGALDAVLIERRNIILDPRTILKCQFGCTGWRHNWTCPSAPGAVTVWEFARIIKRYKKALLIHTHNKILSQKISYEIERKAYLDGYYFAFSLSDCSVCRKCSFPKDCRAPEKARPAMQSVGIDVFATAHKQGLPIKTLATKDEQPDWYSLVLIQ